MASTIDATKPITGNPTTSSVRDNFSAAKTEIEALQSGKADLSGPTFTGTVTVGSLTATGTLTFTGATVADLGSVTTCDINGGAIDGTTVGSTTPAAGAFTTLTASSTATFGTVDINGGAIDGTPIGANSASTGAFTTLSTTGAITQNGSTLDATYLPRNSLTEVITGTTDTLTDAEEGYDLVYTSSSAVTVTLHSSAPVGFQCSITKAGTGSLDIQRSSTDTINGTTAVEVANQWSTVYVLHYEEGKWLVAGDLV